MGGTVPDDANAFRVPRGMDFFGGLVRRWERLWVRLGHLESAFLRDALEACRIEMPIYVSGLARSGSTMLLEVLAAHADVATHRYKDFPPFYTPYWWNWFLDHQYGV